MNIGAKTTRHIIDEAIRELDQRAVKGGKQFTTQREAVAYGVERGTHAVYEELNHVTRELAKLQGTIERQKLGIASLRSENEALRWNPEHANTQLQRTNARLSAHLNYAWTKYPDLMAESIEAPRAAA